MKDYSTKLLGLENVFVKDLEENENSISVFIETEPTYPKCPCCKCRVSRIHDYRNQRIKDLPYRNKEVTLVLKKRRYRCKCGKRFDERYNFLPRYHHMTQRIYESILKELRNCVTFKYIAKRFGVSINTITRVFDLVCYSLYKLPEVLAIDEFKGNAGGERYQAILTNPDRNRLLDILPTREKGYLASYFNEFKRKSVKTFIMDMWEQYKDIVESYFPNAMIVIDKYHYVRQVYFALHYVRKRVQKGLSGYEYQYVKKNKWVLDKSRQELKPHQRDILDNVLSYDIDLYNAYQLKEMFYDFRLERDPEEAEKILRSFIEVMKETDIPEFKPVITAFTNWFKYIINSKRTHLTNAYTEGTNNKIKVLKRIGYGYRNFNRFRNRILHLA